MMDPITVVEDDAIDALVAQCDQIWKDLSLSSATATKTSLTSNHSHHSHSEEYENISSSSSSLSSSSLSYHHRRHHQYVKNRRGVIEMVSSFSGGGSISSGWQGHGESSLSSHSRISSSLNSVVHHGLHNYKNSNFNPRMNGGEALQKNPGLSELENENEEEEEEDEEEKSGWNWWWKKKKKKKKLVSCSHTHTHTHRRKAKREKNRRYFHLSSWNAQSQHESAFSLQ